MSKRFDAVSPRTYEDGQGNEKTAWTRVGRAFEKDGKTTIFLDAYPIPDDNGSVKIMLMEPREREGNQPQQQRRPASPTNIDEDDVGF